VLYGELHILHVSVVVLKNAADFLELCESFRELLLHLGDVHGGTHACYDVFALCVGQELTEEALCTGSGVTCEGNAGTAVIAHVAECHGLYVDSCSPGIRDIVVTSVNVCAGVVPGTENSLDGAEELFLGIVREICADLGLVFSLELVARKAFYMLILLSYLSSQLADELLLLGLVIVLIRILNSLVYLMEGPLFKP
jgi:hypothetical protein